MATPHTVTVEEAKAHLEELVAAAGRGETCVIVGAAGRPAAELIPPTSQPTTGSGRWEAFGMMKGQIEMAPDFDDPLEDLLPYME